MEQRPSWEADSSVDSQEINWILWNLKVHDRARKSLPTVPILSQKISAGSTRYWTIREKLLSPRPTPKLRTTPCKLSETAYLIYSDVPPHSVGRDSSVGRATHYGIDGPRIEPR
jgi:hypothetical protein